MEDVIVRHESMGTLIWSKKYKAYFILKNHEDEKELEDILHEKKVDGEIYQEALKIGLLGKRKEINSNNKEGLMAPLEYYFDFTNVCNLRCSH